MSELDRPSMDSDALDARTDSTAPDARFVVRAAVVGIFILLFIAFLSLASAILLPVVSALIVGTVLAPLSKYAERFHIPRMIFSTAVVGILLAAAYLGLLIVSDPIIEVAKNAPTIGEAIRQRFQELRDNFFAIRYLLTFASDGERLNIDFGSYVKPVLAFLTPALGQLVVFFVTLFLFLIDQNDLRRKLIMAIPTHDARLRTMHILGDINNHLVRYVGTVAVINVGLGLVTGAGLYLLQFPDPVFWGTAAFICNFVPYIGPAFMVVTLLVVGLISFPTIGYAFLVSGLFLALTTIEGQVITPNIIGYNFRTRVLVVFLSLSFWTWLWGPVGAFLSIPLLMIGTVVMEHLLPAKTAELPG